MDYVELFYGLGVIAIAFIYSKRSWDLLKKSHPHLFKYRIKIKW
jgi:hypothetical protein